MNFNHNLVNSEAEQAVLGACLSEPKAIGQVEGLLEQQDFYTEQHQVIYSAILAVKESGEPVDLITVTARLQDDKKIDIAGGVGYLANLANSVPTAANADHYAIIVKEKSEYRKALSVVQEMAAGIEGGTDLLEHIAHGDMKLRAIVDKQVKTDFVSVKTILPTTLEKIEQRAETKNAITGIQSDYPDLDKMTSGFQRSDLITLAARPGVGKTAFALNLAQNIAIRHGRTVGIISLEMPADQLMQRMLCAESNIDSSRIRNGTIEDDEWPKLFMAAGVLEDAPIFIADDPGITVAEIRAKARRLKEREGDLSLLIIDYLQLIESTIGGDNRTAQLTDITRKLKLLARELNVPIIMLSQLSREVEKRADKRPKMSDLRESGSIEQDSDIVIFLHRDEYFNPESERKNVADVIIAKQRSGPTGTVELVFLKHYNKFVSLERAPGHAA